VFNKRIAAKKQTQISPSRIAPETSQTVANQHACLIVNTPEPTLVPNELATSLAPMPNAKMKAMTKPKTTSHRRDALNGSNILAYLLFVFSV